MTHPAERPIRFLDQTMSESEFKREFPAYASYVPMVRAGADTPHKVEIEIFRLNQRPTKGARKGIARRRKAA